MYESMDSERRRSKLDPTVTSNLNVRAFVPEDADAVRKVCRTHFRSLCVPAVKYYIYEHFRDLVVLLGIGFLFQTFPHIIMSVALFLLYLFIRARVELELYISRDCKDLDDVVNYYGLKDPTSRSNFWVAQMTPSSVSIKNPDTAPTVEGTETHATPTTTATASSPLVDSSIQNVVGCVGCIPTRDDPFVAQLVRLVVDEEARRMRIGSRLLAQFENFAVEKGFVEVRLYTNNLNTSHMKFILQHGYEIIQCTSRTLMRGSLIQWKKRLRVPPSIEEPSPATLLAPRQLSQPSTALESTHGAAGQEISKRVSAPIVMD